MSESEESKLVVDGGTLIKQEPLDGDSTETGHNVYEVLIDVFKQENCSNSPEREDQSDCHVMSVDPPKATITKFRFQAVPPADVKIHIKPFCSQVEVSVSSDVDPPKSTVTKFSCQDVSPADMKTHIKAEPSQAEVSLSTDCALTLAALLAKEPKPMNYSKMEEASSVKQICTPRAQQILNKVTVTDNRDMNKEDSAQGGSVARRGDTHTEDTRLSCDQCSYKTVNKRALVTHMKTHTGAKVFSCSYCDYKYSWASSLKRHMTTHTGEKPYSCKHCGYKCLTASYLKTHMRSHTVPLTGFFFGKFLDDQETLRMTSFRDKSALYSGRVKEGDQPSWP
nr:oocyte zinc finger protein XlCOF7.1-like [Maniola hyperantus]